jgi:hypothetical protein
MGDKPLDTAVTPEQLVAQHIKQHEEKRRKALEKGAAEIIAKEDQRARGSLKIPDETLRSVFGISADEILKRRDDLRNGGPDGGGRA